MIVEVFPFKKPISTKSLIKYAAISVQTTMKWHGINYNSSAPSNILHAAVHVSPDITAKYHVMMESHQ